MGRTKELLEDLRYVVSFKKDVYKAIKDDYDMRLISIYDYDMRQHYKNDAEWQEVEFEYQKVLDKKKEIEANIHFKMLRDE
jgi:hypothetical protein